MKTESKKKNVIKLYSSVNLNPVSSSALLPKLKNNEKVKFLFNSVSLMPRNPDGKKIYFKSIVTVDGEFINNQFIKINT